MRKIILGNWKMNGSETDNQALLHAIKNFQGDTVVGVCPPAVYMMQVRNELQGTSIGWGAQDCSMHDTGAYTGEVSASMLSDLGARWCLVGHSERRQYHNETNQTVVLKAQKVAAQGITPVICVGETLAQRETGDVEKVIREQLSILFEQESTLLKHMIIAYEPVWAIGTGQVASPVQANEVHQMIRTLCTEHGVEHTPLLYGGSLNQDNAQTLLAQPHIDGGLVGGASLKAGDFMTIIEAAEQQCSAK